MAVIKTLKLSDYTKMFKDKKFLNKFKHVAYEACYDAILKSMKQLAESSPVDTGLYASAWEVIKTDKNTITFGNTAPYAYQVEKGSPPGTQVPIEELTAWASRQLQLPQDNRLVKSFAWAVKKKIEKQGISPKNTFENGIKDFVEPNLRKALRNLNLDKVFEDAEGT